jgi:hypothetical protein
MPPYFPSELIRVANYLVKRDKDENKLLFLFSPIPFVLRSRMPAALRFRISSGFVIQVRYSLSLSFQGKTLVSGETQETQVTSAGDLTYS